MILFMLMVLGLMISLLMYFISFIFSQKIINKNKLNSFESGFSGVGSFTNSFSIHFFMLILIFVIFELEVVLLISVLYSLSCFNFIYVMLFILGGMYLEFILGKLSWLV